MKSFPVRRPHIKTSSNLLSGTVCIALTLATLSPTLARAAPVHPILSNARLAESELNWKAAANWYRKLLGVSDHAEAAAVGLVNALKEMGNLVEAREILNDLLENKNPFNPDAHLVLAELLIVEKNFEGASQEIQTALQIRPNYPPARERLAKLAFHSGKYGEALKLMEGMGDLSYPIRTLRSKIYLSKNEFSKARTDLQRMLADRPQDIELHLQLASTHEGEKNFSEAEKIYLFALKLKTHHEPTLERLARVQVALGKKFDAIETFRRLTIFSPQKIEYGLELSRVYESVADPGKAEEELFRILKFKPGEERAAQALLDIFEKGQRLDRKGLYLKEYTRLFPDRTWARVAYAKVFVQINQMAKATQILEALIAENQATPESYLLYASISRGNRKPKEAVDRLIAGLRKFPEASALQFALGVAHEENAQPDEALGVYTKIQKAAPHFAKSRVNIALIREKKGESQAALEALSEIEVESGPAGDSIRAKISDLKRTQSEKDRAPASKGATP